MRFRDLLLFIFVPVVISADSTAAVAGPVFVTPVGNQTAAIGREAIFSCSVRNIGKYKVRYLYTVFFAARRNRRVSVHRGGGENGAKRRPGRCLRRDPFVVSTAKEKN